MSTATISRWTAKATNSSGGDFEVCPTGNYPGTIVGLFDVGTHEDTYDGESKSQRKLILAFELAKKQQNGNPFVLAQQVNWSLHKKATFRGLVESVVGRELSDGEDFNVLDLAGSPVMVQVNHRTSNGKTYHGIGAVTQFPEGLPAPTPVNAPPVVWSVLDEGNPFPVEALDWLPFIYGESVKDLAERSREWKSQAIMSGASPANGDGHHNTNTDDIPF